MIARARFQNHQFVLSEAVIWRAHVVGADDEWRNVAGAVDRRAWSCNCRRRYGQVGNSNDSAERGEHVESAGDYTDVRSDSGRREWVQCWRELHDNRDITCVIGAVYFKIAIAVSVDPEQTVGGHSGRGNVRGLVIDFCSRQCRSINGILQARVIDKSMTAVESESGNSEHSNQSNHNEWHRDAALPDASAESADQLVTLIYPAHCLFLNSDQAFNYPG